MFQNIKEIVRNIILSIYIILNQQSNYVCISFILLTKELIYGSSRSQAKHRRRAVRAAHMPLWFMQESRFCNPRRAVGLVEPGVSLASWLEHYKLVVCAESPLSPMRVVCK